MRAGRESTRPAKAVSTWTYDDGSTPFDVGGRRVSADRLAADYPSSSRTIGLGGEASSHDRNATTLNPARSNMACVPV